MSLAESFQHTGFCRFVITPVGRIARVGAGLALIAWGYTHLSSTLGLIVMLFGFLPLATGALDLCLLSALIGGPLSGRRLRG